MESSKPQEYLRLVATGIPVPSTEEYSTDQCFDEGFAGRDPDIDILMTNQIPATEGGTVICHQLTQSGHTFMEMAHKLLSLKTPKSEEAITKSLFEQGKTFSPKQVEDLHKRFVAGETQIGLNTNGCSNFFFVHDKGGRVFILDTDLDLVGWNVDIRSLGPEIRRRRKCRLFSREPKKDAQ
jgi:hypothetical protein